MKPILLLLILLHSHAAWSQGQDTTLFLGETGIRLQIIRSGEPHIAFLALHDDEGSSAAVESVLKDSAGLFIRLLNHRKRMLSYSCREEKNTIDPNRMFGETGLSPCVDSFAAELLALMPDSLHWVSVHTNTEGGFSALSYAAKHSTLSDSIWLQPGSDPDHFILATDPTAYAFFKSQGLNTILQRKGAQPDDGSLSLWADRHQRELITVEAQRGQSAKLRELLLAVYRYARLRRP